MRVWTNVIWAGKCDNRRHPTTVFGENVVVKSRKQVIKCLKFYHFANGWERNLFQQQQKIVNFSSEIRQNEAFRSVYFLRIRGKNLVKSPARISRSQEGVVLFVREKKAPFLQPNRNEPFSSGSNYITRQKCYKRRKLWVRCHDKQKLSWFYTNLSCKSFPQRG